MQLFTTRGQKDSILCKQKLSWFQQLLNQSCTDAVWPAGLTTFKHYRQWFNSVLIWNIIELNRTVITGRKLHLHCVTNMYILWHSVGMKIKFIDKISRPIWYMKWENMKGQFSKSSFEIFIILCSFISWGRQLIQAKWSIMINEWKGNQISIHYPGSQQGKNSIHADVFGPRWESKWKNVCV